jgi:hypothetical protein
MPLNKPLGSDRDEPIWVAINIYMETTQGISLYSYLYLKLTKILCFSSYVICFFFYRIREQERGTGSAQRQWGFGGRLWEEVGGGSNNGYTCK